LNNLKESTGFLTGILKLQEIQISQNWLAICSLMTSDLRSPHNSTFKSLNDKIAFTGNHRFQSICHKDEKTMT
jgi:hypothetical protein